MTDLTDRLALLGAEPGVTPSDLTIQSDLSRGRRALRRRHARHGIAALGLALALATTGGYFYSTHPGDPARNRATAIIAAHPPLTIQLVSYTGLQPRKDFTAAWVPAGYVLRSADEYTLVVAPAHARPAPTSSTPPGATSPDAIYENNIVVELQSPDAAAPTHGTPVRVNGHPGVISTPHGGGDTRWLTYTDGKHHIQVQAWTRIGLTDAQLIEFAAGITVSPAALAPRG
jgi:hypothetical protein